MASGQKIVNFPATLLVSSMSLALWVWEPRRRIAAPQQLEQTMTHVQPVDAAVFHRTKGGQREIVCEMQPLHPDARSLLMIVTGHTPLYLLGVHSKKAVQPDHLQALLELGLIEATAV